MLEAYDYTCDNGTCAAEGGSGTAAGRHVRSAVVGVFQGYLQSVQLPLQEPDHHAAGCADSATEPGFRHPCNGGAGAIAYWRHTGFDDFPQRDTDRVHCADMIEDYHYKMKALHELNAVPGLTWQDKIAYLAYALHNDEECPLTHKFEKGWYIREIFVPAKHIFIGRPHITGHICKLVEGEALLITEEARSYKRAPWQILTQRGFQMVFYTFTDLIGQTCHPNPEGITDVQVLEDRIFEPVQRVLDRGAVVMAQWDFQVLTQHLDMPRLEAIYKNESDIIPLPWGSVKLAPSDIHGTGVFADSSFNPDDPVAPMALNGHRTFVGRYLNHSPKPNLSVIKTDNNMVAVARGTIAEGDELTVDYREVVR